MHKRVVVKVLLDKHHNSLWKKSINRGEWTKQGSRIYNKDEILQMLSTFGEEIILSDLHSIALLFFFDSTSDCRRKGFAWRSFASHLHLLLGMLLMMMADCFANLDIFWF